MQQLADFADVESAVRSGEFGKALRRLDGSARALRAADTRRFLVLRAELLHQTGDIDAAARLANEILRDSSVVPEIVARLTYVLSRAAYECGQFAKSFELMGRSMLASQKSQDPSLLPKAQLALLTLFTDVGRPLPLVPEIRRSVVRAAEPSLMVALRLCFAKAEASRQSPQEARRHLLAASALLASFPNAWLQGKLHLGLSVVDSLCGDPHGAVEQAHLAIGCASRSGHIRTELAGLINLSHGLQALGNSAEARRCVESVLARVGDDSELKVAALDSLANVFIVDAQLEESERVVESVDALMRDSFGAFRSSWLQLTLVQTRVRLLQAKGSWESADTLLVKALAAAEGRDDRMWQNRFGLYRFKGLVLMNQTEAAAQQLLKLEKHPLTLEGFCQRTAILGIADLLSHRTRLGEGRCARAVRISQNLGYAAILSEISLGMAKPSGYFSQSVSSLDCAESAPSPDLDAAVALLELGGHAHILAREALATLDGAGCAAACALIATGPHGPRVIETRGWNDREALAAAGKPETFEVVPLGQHRDEPWQLIVDPKPELSHRCTFIAIRKLVVTAVTLDRYRRDEQQRAALWPAESLDGDPESVWASEQMSEVLNVARRIAATPLSILLTGETGTGKEMLAHTIHRASDRSDRTFLPFNCTAVPREMLESQLFGYRKGAFTGADTPFPGVIRAAAGGTLFLDEIADVSLDVQPKLLRFLEAHEIHPLGEPQPITVDVRVIAATNANLEQLVAAGRFREDLFYRLNVVQLKLPPLRERREEIPALVDHYLRKCGDEQKKGRLTLGDDTLEYLLLYAWPGNIRQLANEVRRMVAMAEAGATLTPALLSPELQASRRTIAASPAAEPEVRVRIDQPLPIAVEMLEQTMVRSALTRSQGRVEEAAKLLGISRKGLFLKRRRWGLHRDS